VVAEGGRGGEGSGARRVARVRKDAHITIGAVVCERTNTNSKSGGQRKGSGKEEKIEWISI
jgi:hypothetical protein